MTVVPESGNDAHHISTDVPRCHTDDVLTIFVLDECISITRGRRCLPAVGDGVVLATQ